MLIVPEIDAPDSAHRLNTAPLVIDGVVHHVPQGNQPSPASMVQVQLYETTGLVYKHHTQVSDSSLPPVPLQILRC